MLPREYFYFKEAEMPFSIRFSEFEKIIINAVKNEFYKTDFLIETDFLSVRNKLIAKFNIQYVEVDLSRPPKPIRLDQRSHSGVEVLYNLHFKGEELLLSTHVDNLMSNISCYDIYKEEDWKVVLEYILDDENPEKLEKDFQTDFELINMELERINESARKLNYLIEETILSFKNDFIDLRSERKSEYMNGLIYRDQLLDGNQTILVLGNGFDLRCRLGSSYSNFFDWSYSLPNFETFINGLKEKNIEKYIDIHSTLYRKKSSFLERDEGVSKSTHEFTLTAWDLYFLYNDVRENKDSYWCDIESEIANSLNSSFWSNVLSEIEDLDFTTKFEDKYFCRLDDTTGFAKIFKFLFSSTLVDYENIYYFLLDELHKLEQRFSKFLTFRLSETPDYHENQLKLIDEILSKTTKDKSFEVISFNYTSFPGLITHTNVHGTLENPIFGISNKCLKRKDFILRRFTKLERRMRGGLQPSSRTRRNIKNKLNIVFYGLSLSPADYDYLKIITSSYSCDKIYFCYSDYNNEDKFDEYYERVVTAYPKIVSGDYSINREKEKTDIVKV